VRVNVQLIDAETGSHIWADRFDRELIEVFALQDEITEHIVAGIEPELKRAEERRASLKRPQDLSAWDHILRATRAKAVGTGYGTREGNEEAKRHLHEAIALDPTSAEALALLAMCEWHDAISGWVDDPSAALDRVVKTATDAMDRDDANWLAHSILALALLFGRREADTAVDEAARAVHLNPSAALTYHVYGCTLEFVGRPVEAIANLEAVFRLDPLYKSRAAVLADLAMCNLLLGNADKAVEYGRKVVSAEPNYVRGRQRLVAALAAAGQFDDARTALAEVLDLQPSFSLGYVRTTYPFNNPAHLEVLIENLRKAGLQE
jgi:adenylate cyclase